MFTSRSIGVYRIVHEASGRYYIGSSNNMPRREHEHRSMLSLGKHHSKFLQAVHDKHGAGAIQFHVVLHCVDQNAALDYEQQLINEAFGKRLCMNGSSKARMPILDPEVRKRCREAMLTSEKYKRVHREVCLARNADPEFRKRLSAAIRSSEKFKAANAEKIKRLRSPESQAKNRIALKSSVRQKDAARRQAAALNADPVMVAKNRAASSRAVVGVHNVTGQTVEFPSQSAAARSIGVYSSNISMCCLGHIQTVKGYRWRYAEGSRSA